MDGTGNPKATPAALVQLRELNRLQPPKLRDRQLWFQIPFFAVVFAVIGVLACFVFWTFANAVFGAHLRPTVMSGGAISGAIVGAVYSTIWHLTDFRKQTRIRAEALAEYNRVHGLVPSTSAISQRRN